MGENKATKRLHDGKQSRPAKKQKKQPELDTTGFVDKDGEDFAAVNLLDSDDEDLHNAEVDDGAPSEDEGFSSGEEIPSSKTSQLKPTMKTAKPAKVASDAPPSGDSEPDTDRDSESEVDQDSENDDEDSDSHHQRKPKSKRNDPSAFASSLSKILSTKLSTTKRADPVLARSAEAHQASKAVVDASLESKARKQLRQQKREALEKGRVKDVLVATRNFVTGEMEEGSTTAEVLETERRLRKVAQRGVVKLFNAVRAAQVKAAEAERNVRRDGVIGSRSKEVRVNEMSKKGFLELIASGGGGLKKGPIEEA
jgi:hypothetical protein